MQISFIPSSLRKAWRLPDEATITGGSTPDEERTDILVVAASEADGIRNPALLAGRAIVDAVDSHPEAIQVRDWFRTGYSDVVIQESERLIQPSKSIPTPFFGMIGQSDNMRKLFAQIQSVSSTMATVLIRGESGTGKELVARAVHDCSDRKDGPFIPVNCAAIPETLLEDDLFGHVRGAFTDARTDRIGKIEAADKGTLFLDEIGDMPPSLQVKLLRVLQERMIQPLGTSTSRSVNVRVVTATAANLEERIATGGFREDLYYRLNVVPLILPPLRDRRADIPLLIDHFSRKLAERHTLPLPRFSEEAIQALQNRDWPGNIRELEHVMERTMVLNDDRGIITPELLPDDTLKREALS